MKSFKEYRNSSINEGWRVSVEDPYNLKKEKSALKFKIPQKPITVENIEGKISEHDVDVIIDFSDGNRIVTQAEWGIDQITKIIVDSQSRNPLRIDVTDLAMEYFGSSGSLTNDLCILYRDWVQGKI